MSGLGTSPRPSVHPRAKPHSSYPVTHTPVETVHAGSALSEEGAAAFSPQGDEGQTGGWGCCGNCLPSAMTGKRK